MRHRRRRSSPPRQCQSRSRDHLHPEKSKGYYPAYYMNKQHWISVALNGAVTEKQLFYILKESYDLT
ncbi:MmcQ/YjbR family DNA-binding protein [Enterococcus mundtii]|nr:MmcQ/YjbR family DNA-binding protein [Enterococcus mundtii]